MLSKLQYFVICIGCLSLPQFVQAEVFYALDEALELAFPAADSIEKKSYLLTTEQQKQAQELAKTKIDTRLFTFYHGVKAGRIQGYAAIESQTVRTHQETIIVVLDAAGSVNKVVVLAFHEPPEYLPSKKWLDQFEQTDLSDRLWPGKGIHGIFGSTLSAQATSGAVRKVLGLHAVLIKAEK